jgi:hypothetical protein
MSVVNEDVFCTEEYVDCGQCGEKIHLYDDWCHVAKNGAGEPVYLCECCVEELQEKGLWHAI